MSRTFFSWILVMLLAGLCLAGCSSGGDITTPDPGDSGVKEVATPDGTYQRYLWDVGEVVIDPAKGTLNVLRPRAADFNLNVVVFMQPPAGPDCVLYQVNFAESNLAEGYVDLTLTLKHPFPQNVYWGHDVRLVLLNNGTETGKYDSSVRYCKPTEFRMVNPDGYTRWWNMSEFATGNQIFMYQEGKKSLGNFIASARVNPYKYFADSVGANDYPPNIDEGTRGEFRSGGQNIRHMILQFEKIGANPVFRFRYAVDTSWKDPGSPPITTDSYPIDANLREAYLMKVNQTGSTVYWNDPGDFGGNLNLNIEIFDWKQGGGTVEDEINRVIVESPTLFLNYGGYIDITQDAVVSPGTSPNSVIFSYTVTNCTPAGVDDQEVLITVEDAITTSYAPPFGGFSHPSAPLAAYYLYGVIVGSGPVEKTITVVVPNGGEDWGIGSTQTINWTTTGPITNVRIQYSDDGGFTFPYTIIDNTLNDGIFVWDPVPDTPTEQAIVKINDVAEPTVLDVSDAVFTISDQPSSLTVLVPDGGESWKVDSSHSITWDSTGAITDVKIEYYKDDDYGTAVEIIDTTTNDGSFPWDPIPNDPTETAKVRVTDADDALVFDDSDDFFEITTFAPEGWTKTIDGYAVDPQPNQSPNVPDICVFHMGDPDFSRGQLMVGDVDDLTVNMFSDDYSTVVGTYDVWLGALYDMDMSPYNRMDLTMRYIDVVGLSCSSDTSPFPDNPVMDAAHCATMTPFNADGEQSAWGFWFHGDASPDEIPENDPDENPWTHITDWDSGILGGPYDDPALDEVNLYFLMVYSEHPDQPQINGDSVIWFNWVDDTSEDLMHPDDVYNLWCEEWWNLAGMSTQGLSPGYVDDTDPDVMRLAIDDDSGLIAGDDQAPVTAWYLLDASERVHIVLMWIDSAGGHVMTYAEDYMGTGGGLGIEFGGTPMDIVVMPARENEFGDWNWLCVLVDTGSGWTIKVYEMDFIGPDPENPELVITEKPGPETSEGTACSFDGDNVEFEFHVVADDGGTYEITVWEYSG